MKTSSEKCLLMALMCKWLRFFVGSEVLLSFDRVMGVFINERKDPNLLTLKR